MKIRTDFVTNSSSSSYIICFARVADKEKAKKVLKHWNLEVFDVTRVCDNKNREGHLGADFCSAIIWDVDEILKAHPYDTYIIIEDYLSGDYNYYTDSYTYSYNFEANDIINDITDENGFSDIRVAKGEGYNG